MEEKYKLTLQRAEKVVKLGYNPVEKWSCEVEKMPFLPFEKRFEIYPYFIFFDFESYADKKAKSAPTKGLKIENKHVPISVSVGDTIDNEISHICDKNPARLVHSFVEELEKREKRIRKQVRGSFMPEDIEMLKKDQRLKIEQWCDVVPILGFNSGSYDLNLIKKYFAESLSEETNRIKVAKKANKIMFILTKNSRFLDVLNYLAPHTSYEKWVKAYECESVKSWIPYDWFDDCEKLDYEGLPEYEEWFSKLKQRYILSKDEYEDCKKKFKQDRMKKFSDWLEYYNNLDVKPGIEAFQKMRNFYAEKEIDILKDAVSMPGVSLHYLLSGSIERGADLYSPNEEAYKMLKNAVVGGPSIVFTRYHEVMKTKIRSHKFREAKLCKNILGYDANALYLSTMLQDMPCGKEKVVYYEEKDTPSFIEKVKKGEWFGFAEVDIEIPPHLFSKFEEMCPFFVNKKIPEQAIPDKMFEYIKKTGRTISKAKNLVGALSVKKNTFVRAFT